MSVSAKVAYKIFAGASKQLGKGLMATGFRGLTGIFSPYKTAVGLKKGAIGITSGIIRGDLNQIGKASMQFLGSAAGATYMIRAAKGRSIFRDRRGKRDYIPFVPFI